MKNNLPLRKVLELDDVIIVGRFVSNEGKRLFYKFS